MKKVFKYLPIYTLLIWLNLGDGIDVSHTFNLKESVINTSSNQEDTPLNIPAEKEEKEEEDRTEEDSDREQENFKRSIWDIKVPILFSSFKYFLTNKHIRCSAIHSLKSGARWFGSPRYIWCHQLRIAC